ncbi:PAS domain S-box protein [Haloparvum sedimenti]|uniref:PAS domain S-box protein n=1 Tax=Haloparvum sedimenti TaxID=1678448 RepID=UPI00071E7CAD|nr:PAS domain S-box protein [Haloparvum sedimenti]
MSDPTPGAREADRIDSPPTDGDDPERPRVVCCLRPGEDRGLLVEWLGEHGYEPVIAEPADLEGLDFECCLADPETVRSVADGLRRLREREATLVPCLLVAEGDPGAVLARLPEDLATVVTDVLSTPLRSAVLERRLDTVTRARSLSREVAESRERYRRLIEQAPAAAFLVADATITYANAAAGRLLGTDPEDLAGREFVSIIDPDCRDPVRRLVADPDAAGEAEFVDARIRRNDRPVPVEIATTAVDGDTVQVIVHDVSRRQAREDQLRLYRRAMDDATIGITISNPSLPDNPLIYVNDEFERLTGRLREEMLGRNPRILQTEDTDPETVARLREAIDAGEPASVEILNRRADGSEWYNALDVTPIHGPDGEVEYFLGFQRDVTDRREREQRLAVLDRVLRHDLRNRLNVVIGHASGIEAGEGEIAHHVDRIKKASENLLSLSNAARRFRSALRGDVDLEPVQLDEVVATAAAGICDDYPHAEIETTLASVSVLANDSVAVAVEELLTNAVVHCDRDPHVRVSLERDPGVDEGPTAVLRVTDNGPGIREADRAPLAGTDETPTEHASGIGLWLVRWTVEDAGGTAVLNRCKA